MNGLTEFYKEIAKFIKLKIIGSVDAEKQGDKILLYVIKEKPFDYTGSYVD